MTELSPFKTREEGGEGGKGWFSWIEACCYSLLPREFPFGNVLQEGAVVALSVDGAGCKRATFPLGHSCSELLFSF